MTMRDVNVLDAKRLATHLKVLTGVADLLEVVTDMATVDWLLQLACRNGELAAYHARRVLNDLATEERKRTTEEGKEKQ
ncbi:hypothetical protein ACIBK8_12495 [Streptomyces sp. NPDC050161]|uniref:hypothetical protein n=1 Tax=Streptomyces sp. NPDC050161 TaxID=3365604 RepID=UPI0037BBD2A2